MTPESRDQELARRRADDEAAHAELDEAGIERTVGGEPLPLHARVRKLRERVRTNELKGGGGR